MTREFLFHFVKILAHEFPFWIRDVWIFYNSFVKRSQDFPKWVIAKLKKYNFNILQYRSKISEPPSALSTRGLEEVNALVLFR